MHSFTNQIERLFTSILMILFGGAIATGVLAQITWEMFLFALAFLLVIRPVSAYLSLAGSHLQKKEKLAISFFGIREMGSLFYLAFAFGEATFASEDELWSIVTLTIALSITIHGLAATTSMRYLKRKLPRPEK